MASVVLLVNPDRDDARRLADDAVRWLGAAGHTARVLALVSPDRVREDERTIPLDDVGIGDVDLAVSLGGDGTFLRLVGLAWAAGVPVLGVNFGRLGYLLEVQPGELRAALMQALGGEMALDERAVLRVTVTRHVEPADPSVAGGGGERGSRSWFALNEVVLEKTVFGHTVRLAASIDGEPFLTYSADGLLIASPTGSTAYNLSAGGPVLSPRLRAMVVTPVAPHLSLDRSLVLHPDQTVTVDVRPGRPAALVVDGQEAGRLGAGSAITCAVAPEPVRLVTRNERGFGGLLRSTLAANRDL